MSQRQRVGTNSTSLVKKEDGKHFCHTVFHDDEALEVNKRLRNEGALDKAKFSLHDNEDIRMFISCPSTLQWAIFKRKHVETYKLLKSADEAERMKGAMQLQLLHPAWVIYDRT